MISNRKPGAPREAPTEPFKRSVASCLKAIARQPEMEVTFAADKPSLAGARARLPEPPRKLTAADAAILRGHADSMALRLACHDETVHRRHAPDGDAARAVFDAAEQARVEAIGAIRMDGVANNLGAMLEDKYYRSGRYDDIRERADAPVEDAVALMLREKLTGRKPPRGAQKIVDLWRDVLEERAGRDLAKLVFSVEDQKAFARAARDLLVSLDMAEEMAPTQDDDFDDENKQDQNDDQESDQGDSEQQSDSDKAEVEVSDEASDDMEEGAAESSEGETSEMDEESDQADSEEPSEAWRPPQSSARESRPGLQGPYDAVRRGDRRGGPVRSGGAVEAARLSRQAVVPPPGRRGAPRQPAAAATPGEAESRLGVRPRRGTA